MRIQGKLITRVFNDTETPYPKEKTFIELFTSNIKKHADNLAVVYQEKQLTYQELNRKTTALAHFLKKSV